MRGEKEVTMYTDDRSSHHREQGKKKHPHHIGGGNTPVGEGNQREEGLILRDIEAGICVDRDLGGGGWGEVIYHWA